MKNTKKKGISLRLVGIIALIAVIGFSMAACGGGGGGGGGIPGGLVGKWSLSDWKDTADFEIKSGGKLIIDNFIYDISVSGNTITATYSGATMGMADYSLSDNNTVMTWSNVSGGLFTGLTGMGNRFYKIGGNNSGGGVGGGGDGALGSTLTITDAQVYSLEISSYQYVKYTGTVPDLKYVDVPGSDGHAVSKPLNELIDGNPSVTLTNGKLNITLGKPKNSSLLNVDKSNFPSGITVSTPNWKVFIIYDIYNSYYHVEQRHYEGDQRNSVSYYYVDKAVNITGKYTDTGENYMYTYNYATNLKAGWNSVIESFTQTGERTYQVTFKTGTPPADCRWVLW